MPPSVQSFHTADRRIYRRVVAVALPFCATFPGDQLLTSPAGGLDRLLVKADRLVRTAGDGRRALETRLQAQSVQLWNRPSRCIHTSESALTGVSSVCRSSKRYREQFNFEAERSV
jgi:hypothetical protein